MDIALHLSRLLWREEERPFMTSERSNMLHGLSLTDFFVYRFYPYLRSLVYLAGGVHDLQNPQEYQLNCQNDAENLAKVYSACVVPEGVLSISMLCL